MQRKPKDKAYCGIRLDKLRDASCTPVLSNNVPLLIHWIQERHNIHKLKDILKLSAPWTKDPILAEYKFTNVRRELDKQTRNLIRMIVNNSSLTLKEKILNIILFKYYNLYTSIKQLKGPWTIEELKNPAVIQSIKQCYLDAPKDFAWFSAAYYMSGIKHAWSSPKVHNLIKDEQLPVELRILFIVDYLITTSKLDEIVQAKDQLECFNILKKIPGLGKFLAYQIFVDCTYIPEFPFSENEFVQSGPGCHRGLKHVFLLSKGLTDEELLFWLRDNWQAIEDKYNFEHPNKEFHISKVFDDLPEYDRCVNVMMLENCMCEFDKYFKAYTIGRHPRRKYRGSNQ